MQKENFDHGSKTLDVENKIIFKDESSLYLLYIHVKKHSVLVQKLGSTKPPIVIDAGSMQHFSSSRTHKMRGFSVKNPLKATEFYYRFIHYKVSINLT
ncbi:hypothetical protein LCGC14_0606300 [marine sediment metagenome]|uniref:Uncharacterized protein n=1 Tax=marine sediment metagenome TaxID=412755 RepID=A0A0F9TV81_9ZZZZ